MKLKHECPYCHNELWVGKKDIKPLSKQDKKDIEMRNKKIESWRDETIKTIFGKKRKRYSDSTIDILKSNPIGKLKCFCGNESLINFEEKVTSIFD